jgi:hypothetical protein
LESSEAEEVMDGIKEICSAEDPCPEIGFVLFNQLSGGDITFSERFIMNSRWSLIVGLVVLGIAAVAASAHAQADLLKATVDFVRASGRFDTVDAPVILIDPRVLIRGGPGSVPKPDDPQHSAADLAILSVAGRYSVPPLQRAIQCQLVAPPECKTNGRAISMRLGSPVVRLDSATVEIMMYFTSEQPSADSLAKLTVLERGVANRSWRSAFHARVSLERRNGTWVAARMDVISRAG